MNIDYLMILKNIFEGKKEGKLHISKNKEKRTLYFKNGFLVFASSTIEEEKLLNIIYELNYMGKKRYKRLVKYLESNQKEKLKLGHKLVFDKELSPMQLYYAVKTQLEKIAINCSKVKKGIIDFKEIHIDKTDITNLKISPIEIILKSIETYKIDKKELGKLFKGSIVKTENPETYDYIFSKKEKAILKIMDDSYVFKNMMKTVKRKDIILLIRFLLKAYIFGFIIIDEKKKTKHKVDYEMFGNIYNIKKNREANSEKLSEDKNGYIDIKKENNIDAGIGLTTNDKSENKDELEYENSDFEKVFKTAEKLYKNKEYNEVIKLIKNLPNYKKSPSKLILLLAKAEARVDIHKVESEKILLEFIKSKPWIREGFYELLSLYEKERLYKRAKPIINKALKFFPDDNKILYFKEVFSKSSKIKLFS